MVQSYRGKKVHPEKRRAFDCAEVPESGASRCARMVVTMRSVRTTVNIDEHLLAEAKAIAARTHRTLSDVVGDALQVMLATGATSPGPAVPVRLPAAGVSGRRAWRTRRGWPKPWATTRRPMLLADVHV